MGWWWDGVDKVVVVLGPCIYKCEAGEEVVDQNPKPSHCGLVLGLPCQMAMLGGGRWWLHVLFDVAVVTDICVCKHKQREGVDAKNLKPSHYGLVLGLPCQTMMVCGGGGVLKC